MRQLLKRLLFPLAIAAVSQIFLVHAEGIRLLGPTGQVQSSPQYSEAVRSSAVSSHNEPSKFYGPTSETETLWSIASKLRPSNQVTVQQTLLALYQLNPESFEQQNIHSLIPGSRLRIPSLVQIRSVTTAEATRVMQAHQQRLDQTSRVASTGSSTATNARTVQPAESASVNTTTPSTVPSATKPAQQQTATQQVSLPAEKIIPSEQPAQTEAPQSVLSFSSSSPAGTDSEILALEEKNHRLTLMLSKVQAEVSDLKSELGDENKVRTEVEKLLAEERLKRAEAERMAPTSLDKLLSNGWAVGALALIPGLLIALLIMWLMGRRKSAETPSDVATESKDVSDKPVSIGDAAEIDGNDDELDDLSLDDDLFSTTGSESEENDTQDEADTDDVFAELDDVDLDLDLGDESEEDLFASIDDDGDLVDPDLDSDFSASANGISVNSEDKAVGLEEMERALEDASLAADEEPADSEDFDLSSDDQVGMSQNEIETLLDGDTLDEDLDETELDQSMLDDLLAEEQDDEFDLGGAGLASDSELEALFDSIEQQADLEQLEANSQDDSFLDEAFDSETVDTPDNEDQPESVTDESTALLDELLDESDDSDDELNWDKELEDLGGFELADDSDDESFDFETLDFDEDLDTDSDLDEEAPPLDDGTELFDELLEIEQHSREEDDDFNREGFIDDLISSAPDKDPLLDEVDFETSDSADTSQEDADDFDFNPEIEGSGQAEQDESITANEFGIPQDTDWDLEDELEPSSSLAEAESDATDETQPADIDDERSAEPAIAPEATQAEAAVDESPEHDDLSDFIDDDALPEFDETAALDESAAADTDEGQPQPTDIDDDPSAEQAIAPEATQAEAAVDESPEHDDLSDFIDDDALPEFDETAALDESAAADTDEGQPQPADLDDEPSAEPAITPEATQAEATVDESPEHDDLSDFIDDDALPEFDETAALDESAAADTDEGQPQPADLDDEPSAEPAIAPEATQAEAAVDESPEHDDLSDFIDDDALPEFDETAALNEPAATDTDEGQPQPADLDDEPSAEPAIAPEATQAEATVDESPEHDDLSDFIDDDALPEFDETAALDESAAADTDEGQPQPADIDDEPSAEPAIAPEATQAGATVDEESLEHDDLSDFIDDDALPEFDETAALDESAAADTDEEQPQPADVDDEPSAEEAVAPEATQAGAAVDESPEHDDLSDFIDDDALPEFDETAALNEPTATDTDEGQPQPADLDDELSAEQTVAPEATQAEAAVDEPPEHDDLSDFIDDDALPEFDETAALDESAAADTDETQPADLDDEPSDEQAIAPEATQAEAAVDEPPEHDDLSDFIDDDALPEFDETAALNEPAATDTDEGQPQPADLDDELSAEQTVAPEATQAEAAVDEPPEHDDLSDFIDDDALPEFDETAALDESAATDTDEGQPQPADLDDEPSAEQAIAPEATQAEAAVDDQPEHDDLSDFMDEEAAPEPFPRTSLDEETLGALLDENAEPEQYVFEPNLDEERIASAGMDFDSMLSMGGEDWNGFKLSPEQQASIPDEVPEEELDVWRTENQTHEPQADSEDWEVQDDLFDNDSGQKRHLTIDELMSQVEGHDQPFEEVDLKLDVGLNEFPDVIGDITNVDVDSNAEAAGKLDLAKIYIEMNDEAGAVKLLEEAIVDGNDEIRQAAKRLIDELNRRH